MNIKTDIALEMRCKDDDNNDKDYVFATTTFRSCQFNPYTKKLCKNICFYTFAFILTICFLGVHILPAFLSFFINDDDATANITTDSNLTMHNTTVLYKLSYSVNNTF
jgi:hypothetical protein